MQTEEIDIETLHASKTNQRVDLNDPNMKELMASIQAVGVLNPIIVRKNADGFEIIAGHRRFAALRRLNVKTAPVQIVEATDEETLKIQITENLQRVDLNPIEEARSFEILAKQFNLDEKAIAEKADKSVAYVTRAMALLTLAPKTQAMIVDRTLTAAHGHQIARVDGKQRETIEKYATTKGDWNKRYPTLLELQDEIEKKVERDLSNAVFPKDIALYGGTTTPACIACPFNTGNQNVLFDGAEKGSCTNPTCFTKRTGFALTEMKMKVLADQPKFKFIGFSSAPGYMGFKEVKGYPVVDMAKRGKDVRANPEKFGFTIQKPSRYDEKSKAKVVIVSLNKKEKPEKQEAGRDWEREQFINEKVVAALRVKAQNSVEKLEKKHLIQMMRLDDDDVKVAKKMSIDDLMVRLWIRSLGTYEMIERLKEVGIDGRDTEKVTRQQAAKEYDDKKKAAKS